ncbi:DUF1819 family protein [Ruminiclostridium herbifermentans]|uniref:DUF1819 family protein n=1 Tax=Ruminiclostridium herbifermentans TaxID=2488810 RepID=A0A4U7J8H1_9FIRM|nr:DUF1819 family protein [Ruminiclostridium herbifermentans]QNU65901.1 DUF1819 family protein [Ruminiclostridium herbifermentans]
MLRYSSTLKEMPLLFNEMRKAASLKVNSFDDKDIIRKSEMENIFQVVKERRKRDLATKILTRLKSLSPELLNVLANGSIDTAKAVALYALLNVDLLFFEFFKEVYSDRHYAGEHLIYDSDFMLFFQRKAETSNIVAKWKDNNLRQLRNAYKKALLEAGFAKMNNSYLEITPPLIEKEVCGLFSELYRKAMCLE